MSIYCELNGFVMLHNLNLILPITVNLTKHATRHVLCQAFNNLFWQAVSDWSSCVFVLGCSMEWHTLLFHEVHVNTPVKSTQHWKLVLLSHMYCEVIAWVMSSVQLYKTTSTRDLCYVQARSVLKCSPQKYVAS